MLFIKKSVKNSFLIDVFIDAEMHFFLIYSKWGRAKTQDK